MHWKSYGLITAMMILMIALAGCAMSPEDKAWSQAAKKNTVESLDGFLVKYPTSAHRDQAMESLKKLGVIIYEGQLKIVMTGGAILGGGGVSLGIDYENKTYALIVSPGAKLVNMKSDGNNMMALSNGQDRYKIKGRVGKRFYPMQPTIGHNTLTAFYIEKL